MRRIPLVARYEIGTLLRRPSVLFTTFGLPLLALLGALLVSARLATPTADETLAGLSAQETLPRQGRIGVVDRSGLAIRVPDELAGRIELFTDAHLATAALEQGEIDAYYLVPSDYVQRGQVTRVARGLDPLAPDRELVAFLLASTLLEGADPVELILLQEPTSRSRIVLENIGERAADRAGDEGRGLAFVLAYALAMLLYVTIFTSAGYLLHGISIEKENRVIEILLTTVSTRELLAGKVIGLGLMGLLQTVVWGVTGALIARGALLEIPLERVGIDLALALLVILYFLFGFLLYSVQMAAIGALLPSIHESGPATIIVVMPALVPLFILTQLVNEPHAPLAVALSLFPFSAPIAMIARLVQGGVPAWQLATSLILLAVTGPLILAVTARLFRAQSLLAASRPSLRQILAVLRE